MELDKLREIGKGIRMIICDMDGTLLDSKKQIPQRNRDAIEKARKKGIYVSICSGRIPSMLPAYSLDLDIKGPLIAANGAAVVDVQSGKVFYQNTIKHEACNKLITFACENNMDVGALTSEGVWFSSNSQRVKAFTLYNSIAEETGFQSIPLSYFDHDEKPDVQGDIFKMLIYEIHPGDKEKAMNFLDTCDDLDYTSSDEGLLDILAPGVSKGDGLLRMIEIMGYRPEEVCVFGDYANDLSMFKIAGLPIAMDNAMPELKKEALIVTQSNDECGVAQAIEKYIV